MRVWKGQSEESAWALPRGLRRILKVRRTVLVITSHGRHLRKVGVREALSQPVLENQAGQSHSRKRIPEKRQVGSWTAWLQSWDFISRLRGRNGSIATTSSREGRVCCLDSGEPISLSICICRFSFNTIFSCSKSSRASTQETVAVHLCLGFSEINHPVNSVIPWVMALLAMEDMGKLTA